MTILSVRHATTYRYSRPVAFGEHRMIFRPRDSYDQKLIASEVEIAPEPTHFRWIRGAFGDCVGIAGFGGAARELRFESRIRLDHAPARTPDFQIEEYAKSYPFSYGADELPDLRPSIERHYPDPKRQLERWVRKFLRQGRPTATGELLKTLTYGIKESFAYERRSEGGTRPPLTTLQLRPGARPPPPADDARARPGQLPRPRPVDDGGGALPRPRGALRLRLHLRAGPGRG